MITNQKKKKIQNPERTESLPSGQVSPIIRVNYNYLGFPKNCLLFLSGIINSQVGL